MSGTIDAGTIDAGTIDVMNGPPGMGEVFVLQGLFDASAVTVEGGTRGNPSGAPNGSGGTLVIDGTLLSDGPFTVIGGNGGVDYTAGSGGLVTNQGTLVNAGSIDLQGGGGAGGYWTQSDGGASLTNDGLLINIGSILVEAGDSGMSVNGPGQSAELFNDGTLMNSGSIEVAGGFAGGYRSFSGRQGTFGSTGLLVNSGTLQLDGGEAASSGNVITAGSGAQLFVAGTLINSGLLSIRAGQIGTNEPSGMGGDFNVSGLIVNSGTLLMEAGSGRNDPNNLYGPRNAGTLSGDSTLLDTGLVLAGSNSALSGTSLDVIGVLALDGIAAFDSVTDSGTIAGSGILTVTNLTLTGAPAGAAASPTATITLGDLINDGTIEIVQNGTIDATIDGDGNSGIILIDPSANLSLEKPVGTPASQTIVFGGDHAGVTFDTAAAADSYNTFDASGFAYSAASIATYDGAVLRLSDGTATEIVGLVGDPDDSTFLLSDDGDGGTLIVRDTTPCFAAGTSIATPDGDFPVEDLEPGDRVLTASGATARIVWIGRRRIACERHPTPAEVRPVRIRANTFGTDLPARDLVLSPDHALYIDERLVPVHLLIDDLHIVQEKAELIRYFHIELERHDILLAENLPAESYLDTGNRRQFANAPIADLHPSFAAGPDGREPCASMLLGGPDLEAIRTRIAHASPYNQSTADCRKAG